MSAPDNGAKPPALSADVMRLGRRSKDPVVVLPRSDDVDDTPDQRYLRTLEGRMRGLEEQMKSAHEDRTEVKLEIRHLTALVTELRIKLGERAWVERLLSVTVGAALAAAAAWLWRG